MTLRPASSPSNVRPRIALVLSSGGLNSLAAIPLMEFLDARGIQPDLLVGCSGGSLVTGLMVCGVPVAEWRDFFRQALTPSLFIKDWRSIATMLGLRPGTFDHRVSIFKSDPLLALIRKHAGTRRLEDLDPPLVLQATDFDTGESVELDRGELAEAVYASCAAYPFLRPIRIDGRWLFDGAFSAPLPMLPAVRRGMDLILAVDFSDRPHGPPRNFIGALAHIQRIFIKSVAQSQALASIDLHGHESVYVKVRFQESINLWDVHAFERILAAGLQSVEEYGEEILAAVQGCAIRAASRSAP